MNIYEFPLAWRWTQSSHAVLPPDVLASLLPLQENEAERIYRRGTGVFSSENARSKAERKAHNVSEDPEATRIWLRSLAISVENRVLLAWDKKTGISLPWHVFVEYWDDFLYPSSDDAFLFPETGESALAWHHYEVFEVVDKNTV